MLKVAVVVLRDNSNLASLPLRTQQDLLMAHFPQLERRMLASHPQNRQVSNDEDGTWMNDSGELHDDDVDDEGGGCSNTLEYVG